MVVSPEPVWVVSGKKRGWYGSNLYSMKYTSWILWVQYLFERAVILKQMKTSVARAEDLDLKLDVAC